MITISDADEYSINAEILIHSTALKSYYNGIIINIFKFKYSSLFTVYLGFKFDLISTSDASNHKQESQA